MRVSIVDYGLGNLFSVRRAFEQCGAEVELVRSPDDVARASRLVLPGVGAFADGMRGLREQGLVEPLRAYALADRPFLGICLGMQMLLSSSEEFGIHDGLDIIPGSVLELPRHTRTGEPHRIPHIGWTELLRGPSADGWQGTILERVDEGSSVYVVHSFAAFPADEGHRLADYEYGGWRVAAALRVGRVYACQFHPEKSGPVGLSIVQQFLQV